MILVANYPPLFDGQSTESTTQYTQYGLLFQRLIILHSQHRDIGVRQRDGQLQMDFIETSI